MDRCGSTSMGSSTTPISIARLGDYNRMLRKLRTSIDAISALPQITTYITRKLKLPREEVISYLEMSSEAEVRSFLATYYRKDIPDDLRARLPYELYCAATVLDADKDTRLSPLRLLELLGAQIVRAGAQHSAIIAALKHPEVVDATVAAALTPEGTSDRNTLHKAVGFLPQPKGAQTTIQIQQQALAQAATVAQVSAPPPELTIRTLVDRFNDRKVATPALMAENPAEYVPEFDGDDEEEEDEDASAPIPVMAPAQRLAKKMHDMEAREME